MTKKNESALGSVYRMTVTVTDKKTGEERSEHRWVAQWRATDYTGKMRTYRSTTNATRGAASKQIDRLKARAEANKQAPKASIEPQTVGEWFDKWHEGRLHGLDTKNSISLRATTAEREKRYLALLKTLLGDRQLRSLTPHDVAEAFEWLRTVHYLGKARSLKTAHQILKKALADVRPRFDVDLFRDIDAPKAPSSRGEAFEQDDLASILETVDRPRPGDTVHDDTFAAIVWTLAHTGLRIGECLALHWRDIDLDRAEILVRASLAELAGQGAVRGLTKSGKSRKVPIDAALVERLRRLRSSSPVLPYVFSDERGGALRASKILTRRLHPVLTELGIRQGGFHRFRHSYASLVLRAGLDVATVSKILGHANPAITMSIYAHCIPGREREASEAIAAALAIDGQSRVAGALTNAS